MAIAQPLKVWAGLANRSRCRHCKQPIVWRVNARTGRSIALDAHAIARETVVDDTRRRFDLFDRDALHVIRCRARRPAPDVPRHEAQR
jgi:hypothetical protein